MFRTELGDRPLSTRMDSVTMEVEVVADLPAIPAPDPDPEEDLET